MLDVAPIRIGAACQLARGSSSSRQPTRSIPEARRLRWESVAPITIGDDTVVGAGAVVTRDLPAAWSRQACPRRQLREIGPDDAVEAPT